MKGGGGSGAKSGSGLEGLRLSLGNMNPVSSPTVPPHQAIKTDALQG